MIDIRRETVVTLQRAAANNKPEPKHISTLHRWRLKGVRGIKLETFLRGGQRCTSEEALERFHQRVTAAADGTSIESPTQTTRERNADIDRAERDLAEMGV